MNMSLNGKLIDDPQLKNTLNEARKKELRGRVDALIVDSRTVKKDDSEFSSKSSIRRSPRIVILDKNCTLSPTARVFEGKKKEITLIVTKSAPPSRIREITKKHPEVEVKTFGQYAINLKKTIEYLRDNELYTVLVEGDSVLSTRMIRERLADEMYMLVYPIIVEGSTDAIQHNIEGDHLLVLDGIRQYGDHIVLHYKVK